MSIENTLAERGNRYGDFTDHARLCQDLKDVMTTFAVVQNTPNSVAVRCPWVICRLHTSRRWKS